jgi:hypothetical protein
MKKKEDEELILVLLEISFLNEASKKYKAGLKKKTSKIENNPTKMTLLRARLSAATFSIGVKNLSKSRFVSSLSSKKSIDEVNLKGQRV